MSAAAAEGPALRAGAAALGLVLEAPVEAALLRYGRLLAEWGARMNLTAIRDPRAVVVRHFLDSLALCARLPAEVPGATLVDVGSGAGCPGAVCALLRPAWRVTLVERRQKKVIFLRALQRELALSNLEVRDDDVQRLLVAGERFGCVVSRATFPPPEWLRLGSRLVAPGGQLWQMLSEVQAEEAGAGPAGFALQVDAHYDVGAGPHRLRCYAAVR